MAGIRICATASSMACCAWLSEPPCGRLKEMVAATVPPWWFTWVAVWLLLQVASADSGTMVSAAVATALPLELPPRLLEMALLSRLAWALPAPVVVAPVAPVA